MYKYKAKWNANFRVLKRRLECRSQHSPACTVLEPDSCQLVMSPDMSSLCFTVWSCGGDTWWGHFRRACFLKSISSLCPAGVLMSLLRLMMLPTNYLEANFNVIWLCETGSRMYYIWAINIKLFFGPFISEEIKNSHRYLFVSFNLCFCTVYSWSSDSPMQTACLVISVWMLAALYWSSGQQADKLPKHTNFMVLGQEGIWV